jgi:2-C-methyl-D-erythritol 4-phosphate cytidylyltransferase
MQPYILITAGGKGKRMESGLPKQFIPISGKPVLMHTFNAFSFLFNTAEFILVLHEDLIGAWKKICIQHDFTISHRIVEGGPKRFHSVKSGLNHVPAGSLVAIHDAVRPLVSEKTIKYCFSVAGKKGNAVPAIPISESMREVDGALNHSVDRDNYKIIQTPQVFHSSLIRKAYQQAYDGRFTDDASVLESIGETIHLVEGNKENIKITDPVDLAVAEKMLQIHHSNMDPGISG